MNQHTTVSRSENADDYFKVVISLNTRWRVIECPDGIQWILQYRASAETYATAPWTGRSCCRIREALIRCISEYCGDVMLSHSINWHRCQSGVQPDLFSFCADCPSDFLQKFFWLANRASLGKIG